MPNLLYIVVSQQYFRSLIEVKVLWAIYRLWPNEVRTGRCGWTLTAILPYGRRRKSRVRIGAASWSALPAPATGARWTSP